MESATKTIPGPTRLIPDTGPNHSADFGASFQYRSQHVQAKNAGPSLPSLLSEMPDITLRRSGTKIASNRSTMERDESKHHYNSDGNH